MNLQNNDHLHPASQVQQERNMEAVTYSREEAIEFINEFFYIFHLIEAEEGIRNLLSAAIRDEMQSTTQKQEDLIYFCKKMEELVKAAYMLK
jgi:hypothetical protein